VRATRLNATRAHTQRPQGRTPCRLTLPLPSAPQGTALVEMPSFCPAPRHKSSELGAVGG
jgi:hypothetical protein